MSENKNNSNNQSSRGKGKSKDSFAMPGDENIVSGKSFFLSFGKQKKGPANPLLASEKNKAENKNAENTANKNGADKDSDHGGKGGGNKRYDNRRNNRFEKGADKNKNGGPDKNAQGAKIDVGAVNAASGGVSDRNDKIEKSERNDRNSGNGGKNGRNDRNRRGRNKNDRRDKNREANPAKPVNQTEQPAVQEHSEQKPTHELQRSRQNEDREFDRNSDRNADRNQRQRQKHKKEKFVPSVPEDSGDETLLQPIVDRAGIIGGAKNSLLRTTKTGFGASSALSSISDGDEPRYVDRNRPLAEQIAEQSKPKTYAHDLTGEKETVEVIGVRFREAGKVYYFDPGNKKVDRGTAVIVETARGVEYGFCAIANRHVGTDNIVAPLKPIIRIATNEDTERYNSNKQLEESAAKVFREKVRQLGLEMSLVYVEYTFDNGKLLFYFTADGRVDFRELIKELAASFRTRIELRQIGVRDEAKIVGGLGICGRPVCCKSFLGEFSQVSIKMAKDQNLFINSSKISGTCGRFMCCIRYEDEVYQKEYERTPKIDAIVETPEGKGVVVESNALKGVVKVLLDDKPDAVAAPFKCTDVKVLGYVKRENENDIPEGMEIPEE